MSMLKIDTFPETNGKTFTTSPVLSEATEQLLSDKLLSITTKV